MNAKRVSRQPGEPSPHDTPTDFRRMFASNLRQAREAAGLSQYALASSASFNPKHLANIENKAANTTLDTITRLARALGLREIDLLRPDVRTVMAVRVPGAPEALPSKTEPSEFRRTFARNLRAIRRAAGLQQTALAQAAAMKLPSISAIEVNSKNVTLDTITLLAKHLGCSEIDLLAPPEF